MKVIGAGFGRTGTESLKTALERLLEGPCYHMREVIRRPGHLERWEAFGAAGRTGMDWRTLFEGFVATTDFPACNYYREILGVFPEARVVLTVRDPASWYDSFQNLLRFNRMAGALGLVVPRLRRFRRMAETTSLCVFPHPRDRSSSIRVFERHNEEVCAIVPSQRLLVYRVHEGWEPLCRFLEVPVPGEPFPHRNRGSDFASEARRAILQEVRQAAGRWSPL